MDSPQNPLDALRRVKIDSRVVEDFRPVAESLEWRLSEAHWKVSGTQGFIEDSVPYASTSGGALAQAAAEVLLANCHEHPPDGPVVVLELCAGTGLFARAFVDAFRGLCQHAGAEFHQQLVYYVTDGSPATLAQWKDLGLFADSAIVAGSGDARRPRRWETDNGPVELAGIRAVFCNYGFDSLPAAIVRRGAAGPEELCVRTVLSADLERVRQAGSPALEELRTMAAATDLVLRSVQSALEPEVAFLPCRHPYRFLDEALERYGGAPRLILNYGAMESISELASMLVSAGFILFSDYGVVDVNAPLSHTTPQQFGVTTAVGLHFPILADFARAIGAELVDPNTSPPSKLHSRLLLLQESAATRARFLRLFHSAEWRAARDRAQAQARSGALSEAQATYEAVLAAYPNDWSILGEVAEFVIRRANDYGAGLVLAQSALALNPWFSTWLWNVYGDAHYGLQQYHEAVSAYRVAESLAPNDVRTQVNLSYAHSALEDYETALLAIAKGFAHDNGGEYHERLQEKQQQILGALRGRRAEAEKAGERRRQRLQAG
ncbi:MAG: hypothetical protein JNM66_06585 [Bryobacterales bacterium]|nr:hypothetical protein [Bryobacterales bacterium]